MSDTFIYELIGVHKFSELEEILDAEGVTLRNCWTLKHKFEDFITTCLDDVGGDYVYAEKMTRSYEQTIKLLIQYYQRF